MLGGADGITVHLREDRRHIQDRDVRLLRQIVTHAAQPGDGRRRRDRRHRLRGEAGRGDAGAGAARGADDRGRPRRGRATSRRWPRDASGCKAAGIEVSLFIDPDPRQIEAAQAARRRRGRDPDGALLRGEDRRPTARASWTTLRRRPRTRRELGLHVHMGHGLNYHNVQAGRRASPASRS